MAAVRGRSVVAARSWRPRACVDWSAIAKNVVSAIQGSTSLGGRHGRWRNTLATLARLRGKAPRGWAAGLARAGSPTETPRLLHFLACLGITKIVMAGAALRQHLADLQRNLLLFPSSRRVAKIRGELGDFPVARPDHLRQHIEPRDVGFSRRQLIRFLRDALHVKDRQRGGDGLNIAQVSEHRGPHQLRCVLLLRDRRY